MSSISFTAHGRCARATVCEPITTGSVGLSVSFAFDAAWSGLQKTAIFRGSGMAVDLVLSGDAATVPPEVLTIPGGDLRVGVWGADPDGNVIIPTVWATVGEIVPGAAPSGFDPDPPTPSWAAQVQEISLNALNTANSVREDANAGAFDGATYTPAVSAGGDLSWTNDKGKPNPPTVNIKGPEGQPGQTGATPDISIGTVETLPPGSPATATMTGTAENPVLSFGIPQGQQGAPGEVTQAEFDALADDVSQQKSAIDDLEALTNRKAGMLVDAASGAIASFVPDATIPDLLGVTVDIEPVQDLHGYDSPWPAGGGANIFDAQAWVALGANRNFYTVASDETITVNSNDGSGIANRLFDVEPGETYAFLSTFSQACRIFSSDSETVSQRASGTFTAPEDGKIAVKFYASAYPSSGKFILSKGATVPTAWTPYSNICPISGWDAVEVEADGENLFDGTVINGRVPFDLKPGVTYTASAQFVDPSVSTYFYIQRAPKGTGTYSTFGYILAGSARTPITFTADAGYDYAFWSNASYTNVKDVQIETGSTAHDYHPYSGNRYTIALGQTVYGGTLDVTAGTLTVDMAILTLDGTQTELGGVNWRPRANSVGFYYNFSGLNIKDPPTISVATEAIADTAKAVSYDVIYSNDICSFAVIHTAGFQRICVRITDTTLTTIAAVNAYLAQHPITICYPLATPIEITLDPVTIAAIANQTNNVWADAGDVDVEFAADLKTYIDQKIAAAVAALS